MEKIEIELHPEAQAEYLEALQWYVDRSYRVGRRFQREFVRVVELIESDPDKGQVFEGPVRFIRLRRFPYVLYYQPIDSNRVQVLAVAHGRRRPGYWHHRRRE